MSHAPTDALEARHRTIRQTLKERSLDALVVTALPNVLYLTNFTGSSGITVITADQLFFLTDFRYVAAIGDTRGTPHECPDMNLVVVDGSYDDRLAKLLEMMPGARVGFEAAHLSVARHTWLTSTLGAGDTSPNLVATEGVVERARVRKDKYELAVLHEAGRRLTDVAGRVVRAVKQGVSERELATAIDARIGEAGFERTAFETIVAAGPNAALPHAKPGERRLSEGDVVVLDFGGVYDSYCVDLTRTVVVGRASERARMVYQAVREAHDKAIRAVKPGVSRFDIDEAARASLAAEGMAEAFGHGTGHGLGIEVHEDPRIGRRRTDVNASDEAVLPGMVFTIEPGAYFPGWGGVRIEDDVMVTESGVELLTHGNLELIEI